MKIILFANSSWNLYNFRKGIIKELINQKYEVYFIGDEDQYTNILKSYNLNLIPFNLSPHGTNIFIEIKNIFKLYFLIKKIKPDYILSFTIKPNLYSLIISYFIKIKIINNITGLGNTFINKSLLTLLIIKLYKYLLKKSYYVFFQNNDDLKYFQKLKLLRNVRYEVIPGSGINLNLFNNQKKKKFNTKLKFIFVGRPTKEKGIIEYCEASKLIIKKFENITFSIIGFNDYNKIKNKYNHINYIYDNNLNKNYFLKFDCLILPSYREGLPRVVLEFSLLGIPSIVTDVPGCNHVIKNNFNGFLCKPKSINHLVTAIEKFISLSSNDKMIMSINSKKNVVENYDERIIVNRYSEILK